MANPPEVVGERRQAFERALAERYLIEREVGAGGSATVYRARDLKHGRDVALKVLHPELTQAVGRYRFLREIEFAARLRHPNILPLHDSGEIDEFVFFVMPFVSGGSLRDRLTAEGMLPVPEAIRITREIAEALAVAHDAGIVHRDIKPENILLDAGHAVVVDFGIAAARGAFPTSRLTRDGTAVGTPQYMSPEQSAGDSNTDRRSDVYSLGCVLYEMLTGEPPYTGPTPHAIMARQASAVPRRIRPERSAVSEELERTVLRALERVPADRFQTAEEFADALGAPDAEPGAGSLPRLGTGLGRLFPGRRKGMRKTPRTRLSWAIRSVNVAALCVLAFLGIRLLLGPDLSELDPEKIVVFPLEELNLPSDMAGAGWDVSLMVGNALEQTDPLKWIEARHRLEPARRDSIQLLSADELRRMAIQLGARYYIRGVVRAGGGEADVSLVLNDVVGDSVYARRTASAGLGVAQPFQLGLRAVRELLPALIDPGRPVDLSPIEDRNLAALALWLQGEREYRSSQFGAALDFYERAVAADSALVLAAVKGAQAADWVYQHDRARQLIDVALRREARLPVRHRYLARGIRFYTLGQSDSARIWLERAVSEDPTWAEARMALGELAYHQLPNGVPLDSLYRVSFEAAAANDPGFSPPLFHLADIATRQGDVKAAEEYLRRLEAFEPDPDIVAEIQTPLRCVSIGVDRMDWAEVARRDPFLALVAARQLAVGGARQWRCAERGLRTLLALGPDDVEGLDLPTSFAEIQASAQLALQGILVSTGRVEEAEAGLDSAFTAGRRQVITLIMLDAISGVPMRALALKADAWVKEVYGASYEGMTNPESQWIMAAWNASIGDVDRATKLYESLTSRAQADSDAYVATLARAVRGHLALARGDASGAIRAWTGLSAVADQQRLEWRPATSLPIERYLLARLLFEQGRYEEAERVASVFDHPEPTVFIAFVAGSLRLRYDAATRLGAMTRAEEYRARLAALGRPDLTEIP